MRTTFKYYFARFIVLLTAIHTLDASIDVDYTAAIIAGYDVRNYDDVDSVSEYVLETISGDPNLIPENDQQPMQKQAIKLTQSIVDRISFAITDFNPVLQAKTISQPVATNTLFHFQDFSTPDYTPPDSATL